MPVVIYTYSDEKDALLMYDGHGNYASLLHLFSLYYVMNVNRHMRSHHFQLKIYRSHHHDHGGHAYTPYFNISFPYLQNYYHDRINFGKRSFFFVQQPHPQVAHPRARADFIDSTA